jgi:hypothetical protein
MNKRSQILMAAIVMLVVSALLCRGVYTLWTNHAQSIGMQVASGQAFYLAQAALERAKADLMLNATRAGTWPRTSPVWISNGTKDFGNFNANIPLINANYYYSIVCEPGPPPGNCSTDNRDVTATAQISDLGGKLLATRKIFVIIANVSTVSTQDPSGNMVANSWEEQ